MNLMSYLLLYHQSPKQKKNDKNRDHSSFTSSSSDESISLHDSESDVISEFNDVIESEMQHKQQELNLSVGSFVVAKLIYDKDSKKETIKKFIGQIISVDSESVKMKFMRKSRKCTNVYIFPNVEDIMQVQNEDLLLSLTPKNVSRGRYTFDYDVDI